MAVAPKGSKLAGSPGMIGYRERQRESQWKPAGGDTRLNRMNGPLGAALLAGAMLVVAACGDSTATPTPSPAGSPATAGSATPATGGTVGIALPATSSPRWTADGDNLVNALSALGYATDLQFAGDDEATQVAQVERMIAEGAKVLVIAPVDGGTLTDALQKASDAGIRVLAYARQIRDSPNVDYFTTFDDFKAGVLQARSIVDALDLRNAAGPFNIELFAGSPGDDTAALQFDGAMSILQPFIDRGKLIVQSGEVDFPAQVGTLGWDGTAAGARLGSILATHYADKRLDAVLAPSDGISRGIIASLKQAGYYTADQPAPIVTGRDAELVSVKSMLAGEQTSTVFEDGRLLATQTAAMVDQLVQGKTVDVNDTTTWQNGVKIVPSFLVDVVGVTSDNARQVLVDSGYYTADQLAG